MTDLYGEDNSITVVGGCGHVGLPLAVALANKTKRVVAFDISDSAVKIVNEGFSPFWEPDLERLLLLALKNDFKASADVNSIATAEVVIIVVGTPIDVHLNPDPNAVINAVKEIAPYLNDR